MTTPARGVPIHHSVLDDKKREIEEMEGVRRLKFSYSVRSVGDLEKEKMGIEPFPPGAPWYQRFERFRQKALTISLELKNKDDCERIQKLVSDSFHPSGTGVYPMEICYPNRMARQRFLLHFYFPSTKENSEKVKEIQQLMKNNGFSIDVMITRPANEQEKNTRSI